MSAAMALRLLFGVLCGGVLAWVVWDRSERELQTGRGGKSMSGRASCPSAAIIICQ